jgi:YXWGXW repeat-containing protein
MNKFTRAIFVAAMLLGGVSALAAQVSIGIRIGPPPPARVVRVLPPRPAPEFMWIEGYWYPVGSRYRWHEGYWTRPPYEGARWVPARHDGERFYEGYWEGDHGRVEHDHRWDHDRERDHREHDNGRGHAYGREDRGHDRDDHDRGDHDGHDR